MPRNPDTNNIPIPRIWFALLGLLPITVDKAIKWLLGILALTIRRGRTLRTFLNHAPPAIRNNATRHHLVYFKMLQNGLAMPFMNHAHSIANLPR